MPWGRLSLTASAATIAAVLLIGPGEAATSAGAVALALAIRARRG
ncbi:MAG: hypothetical protein ACJ768_09465 [Gaiellaceae bacterium]